MYVCGSCGDGAGDDSGDTVVYGSYTCVYSNLYAETTIPLKMSKNYLLFSVSVTTYTDRLP